MGTCGGSGTTRTPGAPRSAAAISRAWPGYRPAMEDADGYFGERVAAAYDDSSEGMFSPEAVEATAGLLAELAGGGRALELGIGTGRIALPLARRGVEVHGIDLSRAMVARLRAKPGGDAIGVSIGDFATAKADGTFSLVYLVFNTIMNLTTQDAQVACTSRSGRRFPRVGRGPSAACASPGRPGSIPWRRGAGWSRP